MDRSDDDKGAGIIKPTMVHTNNKQLPKQANTSLKIKASMN